MGADCLSRFGFDRAADEGFWFIRIVDVDVDVDVDVFAPFVLLAAAAAALLEAANGSSLSSSMTCVADQTLSASSRVHTRTADIFLKGNALVPRP